MGYRIVMDYKQNDLGRQANSGGAVLVDGCFYCPALPELLVSATGDQRAGTSRRRVRGIAAQSVFCAFLLMAANIRKIRAYRELVADRRTGEIAERARRRRMSIAEYRGPP